MIFTQHIPGPPLDQFVDWFWFYDGFFPVHRREHVLPDGTFELVIDLRTEPRKLFDCENPSHHREFRRGWLSGAHAKYLVIDALPDSSMIGVHFRPGGAGHFLRFPASEMRDQVVELESIWGRAAQLLREDLLATRTVPGKFRLLEEFLSQRLITGTKGERAENSIRWAVSQIMQQPHLLAVSAVADQMGISHKHFIAEFSRRVGLTPKIFGRIRRFQRVLDEVRTRQKIEWTDIALSCGYFDQAHFVNDFQAFSGLNPTRYLAESPEYPNYVPVLTR
jgi:AraC-like DNA-binding protein